MTEEFPYRPFCSRRCKDIDFGDWAMERHAIEDRESEGEEWDADSH